MLMSLSAPLCSNLLTIDASFQWPPPGIVIHLRQRSVQAGASRVDDEEPPRSKVDEIHAAVQPASA
jgi:hypothetical protein